MCIGAGVMFLFSFFAIIAVAWADLCVNLDRFEDDPVDSQLGTSMTDNLDGSNQVIEIVNACWAGSDLLDAFNLTDVLDWSAYRDNLTDILDIDITNELSLEQLDSFVTEVNILNTDEFEVLGDQALAALNAVGGSCTCYNNDTQQCGVYGAENGTFTRDKLQNDECYDLTGGGQIPACWADTFPSAPMNGIYCAGNFSLTYATLMAEIDLQSQTDAAIDDIQSLTNRIVTAYDGMFGVAVDVEDSIENISCQIDPLFESFDALIENYTNCGFLGEAYGDFKEIGCVTLFNDMYWISYAMMVIAFTSLPIVCLAFMSQTSWHFEDEDHLDKEDDGMFNFGRQISRTASQRLGLGIDEQEPMASTADHIEFGMAPVGPAPTEGGQPSAPPGSPSWDSEQDRRDML